MIQLRSEQRTTVDSAKIILAAKRCVYIAAEVRTGKNFMSFTTAKESNWNRVGFITKKKALIGVNKDYNDWSDKFDLFHALNFEQVHKLHDLKVDGWIIDEAHALGQHPKPSQRTKAIKELVGDKPVIWLSGSPHPETPSQIYHQFWVSQYGPFQRYVNFYKWSKDFVNVKQRKINGWMVNDYSHAKEEEIKEAIRPYMVHLSQEDAGFTSMVEEEILKVPIDEKMYSLMERLKRDKIYTLKSGEAIIADTPARLQSLYHQLSSGTLTITEIDSKNEKEIKKRFTFDESKAWFIKSKFVGHKIAIFYKFIAEGELLRKLFPDNTADPEEFNKRNDLTFICQIISGREGVNLSTADALVMYNIDFSATSYWQARARMQTKDRVKASKLYWIFSEKGIEKEVHKAVSNKKNFTLQFFKKVYQLGK
jgi:hypothetical protein